MKLFAGSHQKTYFCRHERSSTLSKRLTKNDKQQTINKNIPP
mgnify:FL=1